VHQLQRRHLRRHSRSVHGSMHGAVPSRDVWVGQWSVVIVVQWAVCSRTLLCRGIHQRCSIRVSSGSVQCERVKYLHELQRGSVWH
jgi:hypothetical protein